MLSIRVPPTFAGEPFAHTTGTENIRQKKYAIFSITRSNENFAIQITLKVLSEEDETRTHTTQRSLPPQSSASTNSATSPFNLTIQCSTVPRTGLEPARLSTLAPETSASTIPPPGH